MASLFRELPKMPERVVILGTGRNGAFHFDRLDGEYIIGLNGAIDIRDLNIWMVKDHRIREHSYYYHPVHKSGIKIFSQRLEKLKDFIRADYYYKENPGLGKPPARPVLIDGVLRSGATIGGAALQLAYWCGAKTIWLCGLDFQGDAYWNGKKNYNIQMNEQTGVWLQIHKMNLLISEISNAGVTVQSMSETALRVNRVD